MADKTTGVVVPIRFNSAMTHGWRSVGYLRSITEFPKYATRNIFAAHGVDETVESVVDVVEAVSKSVNDVVSNFVDADFAVNVVVEVLPFVGSASVRSDASSFTTTVVDDGSSPMIDTIREHGPGL